MTGKTHRQSALVMAGCAAMVATAATQSLTYEAAGITFVPLLWIPMSIAGGYTPDVDKKKTTAYNWFIRGYLIYIVLSAICIPLVLMNISSLIPVLAILAGDGIMTGLYLMAKRCGHRMESHSLLFVGLLLAMAWFAWNYTVVINAALAIVTFNLLIGYSIGIISHIFVDEFNIKPMTLFFPLEHILGYFFKKRKKVRGKNKYEIQPVYLVPTIFKISTSSPAEKMFLTSFTVLTVLTAGGVSAFLLLKAFEVL